MKLEPKLIELLNKRGITSDEDIAEFLSDKPQKTYDPLLLLNMEAGVDLILSAIDAGEKICIYGDYDADGITSTSIMLEVLSSLKANLTYYIPSRFDEGYGLNCSALDSIKAAGVDLVVTVDCGSVSVEEVEHAKEIGLKIMVTDHHNVTDRVANCLVINPMQPGDTYPFRYLAGCGVAFKLAQAIVETAGLPREVLTRTLDLVGIGTIGDVVPLIDENRTLAKYGLRAINIGGRRGLDKLIEETGLKPGCVTSENVSYVIVPHLNAAGRMKTANIGVSLLIGRDEERLDDAVKTLMKCNSDRKSLQSDIFDECCDIIESEMRDDLFYLIYLEKAHEGITGIVAGKLKERYGKPTVILTPTGDGCLKGTGRSIESVDIYLLLKRFENLFLRFGGHAAACGFTMKSDELPELRTRLGEAMKDMADAEPDLFDSETRCDLELNSDEVTADLAEEMKLLAPFGCGNEMPLIRVSLRPCDVRSMGSKMQYRRFSGQLANGRNVACVIFSNAERFDALLSEGRPLNVIGTLENQSWNDKKYLQINVADAEEQVQK